MMQEPRGCELNGRCELAWCEVSSWPRVSGSEVVCSVGASVEPPHIADGWPSALVEVQSIRGIGWLPGPRTLLFVTLLYEILSDPPFPTTRGAHTRRCITRPRHGRFSNSQIRPLCCGTLACSCLLLKRDVILTLAPAAGPPSCSFSSWLALPWGCFSPPNPVTPTIVFFRGIRMPIPKVGHGHRLDKWPHQKHPTRDLNHQPSLTPPPSFSLLAF
ncbi:hypothetical protein N656DRAFT_155355 [Canariomyces notabilis]|uniref:Uncharacterized protein n=1 Tax=Canariomyces notabilis TaxID=2074819 RepID=A0AAN6TBI8_9PEZI|nr:hypothetical protein N656DRAFT_155355 [Canariomyces arenarius]